MDERGCGREGRSTWMNEAVAEKEDTRMNEAVAEKEDLHG